MPYTYGKWYNFELFILYNFSLNFAFYAVVSEYLVEC